MTKAGLPYMKGSYPYVPKLVRKPDGDVQIDKPATARGVGWGAADGKIWVRGEEHAGYPRHWDVQFDAGGSDYDNVTDDGKLMSKEDQKRMKDKK